jgi:lysine decarboxylase
MSDHVGVVCLVTIGDTQASVDRLVDAFATLSREHFSTARQHADFRSSGVVIAAAEQVMTPREAFFAPARAIRLAEASGCVSAELVIPYPPGIPVLTPGEIIGADKVAYLQAGVAHGMYLSGPSDPTLETIRVVI